MRNHRQTAILWLIISCCTSLGCNQKVEPGSSALAATNAPRTDYEIKVAALKGKPQTSAITLKSEHTVKSGEGGKFVYPSSFTFYKDQQVLISDNNGHTIHRWSTSDPETAIWSSDVGDGSLVFPITIQAHHERVYVSDNDGIKIFRTNGRYESLLRIYYALFNFLVSDDRSIYANAEFRTPKDNDPLIIKLGPNGERVSGFGQTLHQPNFKGFENRAFLDRSGQVLVAGFKHRPLVEMFDLSTEKLVREFPVSHVTFDELQRAMQDRNFTNPTPSQVKLPRFIAGVSVFQNSVFVLLHLPHIEIVEFSFDGAETRRYRSTDVTNARDYFGFEVRKENGSIRFYVGVAGTTDTDEIPFLTQFSVADADRANGKNGE